MNANAAAERPSLLLSRLDVERIEALIEQPQFRGIDTRALRGELERADIAEPADMPADVITMNSVARVRVDDGERGSHEHELALVYPRDADGSAHKVSILAPVGSALLGLRAGESIDWPLPGGRNARLHVLAIRFQPEAAGELHR
jgi:regulator of nucleoside diphosphate kinase